MIDPSRRASATRWPERPATEPQLARARPPRHGARLPAAGLDQRPRAHAKILAKVTFRDGTPVLPAGDYGPVQLMLSSELTLARPGSLDASLLAQHPTAPTSPGRCCSSRTATTSPAPPGSST